MNIDQEISIIDQMIKTLRNIKTEIKRRDKLNIRLEKAFNEGTERQITNLTAELNWQCMELEKRRIDFARLFEDSPLDVGTGEHTFRPSGFHTYKY